MSLKNVISSLIHQKFIFQVKHKKIYIGNHVASQMPIKIFFSSSLHGILETSFWFFECQLITIFYSLILTWLSIWIWYNLWFNYAELLIVIRMEFQSYSVNNNWISMSKYTPASISHQILNYIKTISPKRFPYLPFFTYLCE